MESAITSRGQATIPREIREHLGLKPSDRVKFFVHPNGSVVLLPTVPVSKLRGIVEETAQASEHRRHERRGRPTSRMPR